MYHLVHSIPGRLRVKLPGLKRNEQEAAQVRAFLARFEGVLAYQVTTLTGSVIIRYDPTLTNASTILATLPRYQIAKVVPCLPQPASQLLAHLSQPEPGRIPTLEHYPHQALLASLGSSLGAALSKMIFELTLEKLVERFAFALVKAML